MIEVNFNKVPLVQGSEKWRDLDKDTARKELIAKIVCFAGALILLAAVIVSSYYLAGATDTSVNSVGDIYTISMAPLMVLPILFGSVSTVAFGVSAFCIDLENEVTNRAHNDIVNQLTTQTWKALCELYSNKSFQQLVREQYITVAEGGQFKTWRAEYEKLKRVIDAYEDQSLIKAKIDQLIFPKEYAEAREKLHELEKQWRIEQNVLRKRAQLDPLGEVDELVYEEMDGFSLLQPTTVDRKWRDLSKKQIRDARIAGLTTVALGVVLLSAIALSCYFLATTDNALFCLFPGMVGFIGLAGFIYMGCWASKDMGVNGIEENLDRKDIQLARFLLLTEGKLEEIYTHYHRKNGGLTVLVKKGFLTVDQAKTLRELLLRYHAHRKDMKPYANIDDGNSGKQRMKNRLDALENRLKKLQELIKESLKEKKEPKEQIVAEEFHKEQKDGFLMQKAALHHVLSYLNLEELGKFARVSKRSSEQVSEHIKLKVNANLGYKVGTEKEAKQLLRSLINDRRYAVDHNVLDFSCLNSEMLVYHCEKGDFKAAERFLTPKVDTEVRNEKGKTPLMLALLKGNVEFAEKLLKQGADGKALDHKKRSPLSIAQEKEYQEIVNLIPG